MTKKQLIDRIILYIESCNVFCDGNNYMQALNSLSEATVSVNSLSNLDPEAAETFRNQIVTLTNKLSERINHE